MSLFARYRHYLGALFDPSDRWKLVFSVVASILLALLDTGSVLLIAPLVSALGSQWKTGTSGMIASHLGITTQGSLILVILLAAVTGFIVKDLLAIAYTWWSARFSASCRARTQILLSEYFLRLPYEKHSRLGLDHILRKTLDTVRQSYYDFTGSLLNALTQFLSIIFITAALLIVMPIVTITVALYLGITSWIFLRSVRSLNEKIGRESLALSSDIYARTIDAFGAIKEAQLRHAYPLILQQITRPIQGRAYLEALGGVIGSIPKQLIEILFMSGLGISVAVAVLADSTHDVLSTLALLVAAAFRLLPTVAGFIGSLTNLRRSEPGVRDCATDRVAARFAQTKQLDDDAIHTPLPLTQDLVIKNLRFHYSEGPDILNGINLTIPAGTTVALVGGSGAGKSTLLDILMGLLEPTAGQIMADGMDIYPHRAAWQRNIGLVPQEVYLMDRTIAENVAFDQAREDIDEDRVRTSLAQADILDFVEAQPEGIWSTFGERGKRLSGGQRQRIGIARALYRQPAILVLDEATSALDNETEARIAQTVAALRGSMTVIIVAHRLSTVKNADLIAYLADGRVEATGTFLELQERSEGFRHLVELASFEEIH